MTDRDLDGADAVIRMLFHFKREHEEMNKALIEEGEEKYLMPFEHITVKDIKDYILELKGIDSDLIDI